MPSALAGMQLLLVMLVALCACCVLWVQASHLPAHLRALGLKRGAAIASTPALTSAAELFAAPLLPPGHGHRSHSKLGNHASRRASGRSEHSRALSVSIPVSPAGVVNAAAQLPTPLQTLNSSCLPQRTPLSHRVMPSPSCHHASVSLPVSPRDSCPPAVVYGASSSSLARAHEYFHPSGGQQAQARAARVFSGSAMPRGASRPPSIGSPPTAELMDAQAARTIRMGTPLSSGGGVGWVTTGPTCTPTRSLPPPRLLPPPMSTLKGGRWTYPAPAPAFARTSAGVGAGFLPGLVAFMFGSPRGPSAFTPQNHAPGNIVPL